MAKFLLWLFSILLAFPASAQGSSTLENADNASPQKPITVAVVGDYPPYDIYQDGNASGIAIDMTKEVFARLNIPIIIRQLPFKRALEYVKSGFIDGLSGVGKNTEREQYILYPKTQLATTNVAFFVRKDSNILFRGDLREMAQHRIGTVDGFMYTKDFNTLVAQNVLHIDESLTVESNIQKLLAKRYNVFVANSGVTTYVAKQLGVSSEIQELSPPIDTGYMYLGISKKSPLASLIDKINTTLIAIREDGTEKKIYSRYTK